MSEKRHGAFKRLLPTLGVSVISFCLLAIGISIYVERSKALWEKDERLRLLRILNNKRSNLENELYARIYYTKSVAAYVSLHPEIEEAEYNNLASELIQSDPVINTMSLARDGIIGAVYPKVGHEPVIGLNLRAHPDRLKIVEQTIRTGKTFLAGPVELVEGGLAFISYTPVFDKTSPPPYPFWGMTDIVIKRNELLRDAGMQETELGARFAIRGYDGLGHNGAVFFGASSIFEQSPVTASVILPDGEWIVAAIPALGWSSYLDQDKILLITLILSSMVISILLGISVTAVYRIRKDTLRLQSIFKAMSGSVLELNNEGLVVSMAPTIRNLPAPFDRLEMDTLMSDILDGKNTKSLLDTIAECLRAKEVKQIELKLGSSVEPRWILMSISPKEAENVIAVVQDMTQQKEQEVQLARLNANKDKFFSIIAHDLRTPLSAITGLSDQLLDMSDEMPEESKKEYIELIYQSGKENLLLLENLLTWARSQQTGLRINRKALKLHDVTVSAMNKFRELARHKDIQIINTIEVGVTVAFDQPMLESILRNLISNAIKFSGKGGKIELGLTSGCSKLSEVSTVEVFVRDQGVGMGPETLQSIMNSDNAVSLVGTAKEVGTGLGLQLCKEFLAKHQQTLRIKSEINLGTTVYFTAERAISPHSGN